jgi:hypothetical protein
MASRDQIRRLPRSNSCRQRQAQGLHAQRFGLDQAFIHDCGALDVPGQAIVDGEVVVIHEGRTNFSELQADLSTGRHDRLVYYAFDLLWLDGDLRKLQQIERKEALLDLIGENGLEAPIVYSEHLTGDGQQMFEHAAKLNWEGIVSKRADVPYRSERTEAWLKIKTVQKGKFPVIGFVKDATGVAALWPRPLVRRSPHTGSAGRQKGSTADRGSTPSDRDLAGRRDNTSLELSPSEIRPDPGVFYFISSFG